MRCFCLSELEIPLAGSVLGADTSFDAVSTDSRSLQPGELFVALQGPSFDGHRFVEAAAARGAGAALVSQGGEFPVPALRVSDTRLALGQLAALNRQQFAGRLVGITGSSGKTTAKNMLALILRSRAPTLATVGNLNNEIGLPLTLLQLQEKHEYAVIEMGASRAGDISYLCGLARPDVAVLLNAMPAHLEGFGDLDGVASAKGEIFAGLGEGGVAVINADSPFAQQWRDTAGAARRLEFGLTAEAGVRAEGIADQGILGSRFVLITPDGEAEVELSLPGAHNVLNALAATAAALAVGIDLPSIAGALGRIAPEPGRMQVHRAHNGMQLIDDSYNANPGSVMAAVDMLAGCAGRRVLILGYMAELGADAERLHEEIGRYAASRDIEELWTSGSGTEAAQQGFGEGARHCADMSELTQALSGRFGEGDVVLVKGSRSAGMEAIVAALLGRQGGES